MHYHTIGIILSVFLTFAAAAIAQSSGQPLTSIDQILRLVPPDVKLGSKTAINPVGAETASKLTKKALYRPIVLRVRVRKVEKIHSPLYQTDYRIYAEPTKTVLNGVAIKIETYLYFVAPEAVAKLARVSEKDTITVSGLVRRADFLNTGVPTFMFDMINADIR